jgi:outer membrane lipoprotein carrier protein
MKNLIAFALLISLMIGASPLLAESDQQKALDAIQEQFDLVNTFKADFEQKSYVKLMNQTQTAKGQVQIKKPGKMRWEYKAPEPQILVSDHKTLWLYVPEDEQVTKVPVASVYSSNTPALFLSGRGKLTEIFNVLQVSEEGNEITVVLGAKTEDQNLDRLVLYVDNKNYQITGSTVYDKLGNRTDIRFQNIKINMDIPAETFQFNIPEGVELLDYTANP